MKAEFKNDMLTLWGESEEETVFLKKAFQEGLRVFCMGGNRFVEIALPSEADLEQFHLTPTQKKMVVIGLARSAICLSKAFSHNLFYALLFKLFSREK